MHDAKGRPLQVGDTVLVPAKVVQCSGDENFCCLDVETLGVMPGNGHHNRIYALSTKQVYRANDGDEIAVQVGEIDGKQRLV